jgi:hypothetical protein
MKATTTTTTTTTTTAAATTTTTTAAAKAAAATETTNNNDDDDYKNNFAKIQPGTFLFVSVRPLSSYSDLRLLPSKVRMAETKQINTFN